MSFLRKKKVKFNVELKIEKLTDVPLLNAIIFAKVRLLECGSFVGVTLHRPVCSHQVDFMDTSKTNNIRLRVRTISGQIPQNPNIHRHSTTGLLINDYPLQNTACCQPNLERRHSLTEKSPRDYLDGAETDNQQMHQNMDEIEELDEQGNVIPSAKNPQPFEFVCYIPYDSKCTGELEACRCKISLRKEDRAGRNPQKLGFVIVNLSEFAGTGSDGITKSFLLDGYGGSQRQDNSRVHIFIRMQHNSADPLFKVPNSSTLHEFDEEKPDPIDRKAPPPSPTPTPFSGCGNVLQVTTTNPNSATATPIQIDSLSTSTQAGTSVGASSLSGSHNANVVSTFPTVPGGLGHNMSMRVQKTRRDPDDIIKEVFAESDAIMRKDSTLSSSSGSSDYKSS